MKKTILFLTFCLLFFTFDAVGQTKVTITPKKVTYTRKGRNVEKYKKTFTVRYPIVSGALKPAIKTKLENTISFWRVYETTLKESMEDTGVGDLDYVVNYNGSGILDITLTMEYSAAYPSTSNKNLVVDLKTGEQVKFADVLTADAAFAAMIDKKLQAEKAEILKSIQDDKEESQESKDAAKEAVEPLKFTVENFETCEIRVNDKGVAILYDAEFPHVIQALQPAGNYFFTYAQLKPFIKKENLLGKFVR